MTPSQPAPAVEPVLRALCVYLAGKSRGRLSPEQFDPDANVWLAGYVDSLAYVEFLVFIEERYAVTVTDVDLTSELNTIGAIARFISAQGKREAAP